MNHYPFGGGGPDDNIVLSPLTEYSYGTITVMANINYSHHGLVISWVWGGLGRLMFSLLTTIQGLKSETFSSIETFTKTPLLPLYPSGSQGMLKACPIHCKMSTKYLLPFHRET